MRSSKRESLYMKRFEQVKANFERALKALEDAMGMATADLEIDGALQRFEFTFELFWKFLKSHLERQGIITNTPKQCFKEAYQVGLLEEEETVLQMLDDRNLTVHLYDLKTSREIFQRVKATYVAIFRSVLDRGE